MSSYAVSSGTNDKRYDNGKNTLLSILYCSKHTARLNYVIYIIHENFGMCRVKQRGITNAPKLVDLRGGGQVWGQKSVYTEYILWYTHKTSGFKTSGFKTSGFKTFETSGLQNVRFTKRQVYKMSGLQNGRSAKRPVAKRHPYIFCTCGWWKSAGSVAAMFAGKVMAVFYSLF